ncbi:hypothetical protein POX83_12100, partial [Klebsiella aerogenes]
KSAQIREILISESAWEEMTCLFAPSLIHLTGKKQFLSCLGLTSKPLSSNSKSISISTGV